VTLSSHRHHLLADKSLLSVEFFTVMLRIPVFWIAFLLLIVSVIPGFAGDSFLIKERTLRQAEDQYGISARKRLLAWQDLIRTQGGDDLLKLEEVNRFFNRIPFISDIAHWGKEDYWATPTEFLASNGGDCEDFAIAKYFTLIRLGVAEKQLTLTYVTALSLSQSHLVLLYYPGPGLDPLVLDSLADAIEPSSRRTDLLPIYSFNASDLWAAKQRGKGDMIGNARRVKPWRELLAKMIEELP
jgi:predicted transglutaminase-like cysteine proteinase